MEIITHTITLNAKLEKVWEFITKPENFPKYVYGYTHGKTSGHNATGIGASYEWHGKFGPFKLKSVEKIVTWQERKHVAYSGKLCGVAFDSSMNVKEANHNQTILTVSIQYKAPFYFGGKVLDILLIKWIVKSYVDKSLRGLNEIFNSEIFKFP